MKKAWIVLVIASITTTTWCMQKVDLKAFDSLLKAQAIAAAKVDHNLDWLPNKIALIEKSDDINATDDLGNSRLHYAAFLIQIPTMKTLIHEGADVTLLNKNGQDALLVLDEMLSRNKNPGMRKIYDLQFKALLQALAKININQKYAHGSTVLHLAAMRQYPDLIQEFIALKAKPNVRSGTGNTALHFATAFFTTEAGTKTIQTLLNEKVSPDIVNNERQTPLHLLLTQYLKPTQKNALSVYEFVASINSLIDAMHSLNTQDKRGNTPLHLVTASSMHLLESSPQYHIIEKLLEKKANPNLQNKDGFTSLHNAVLQKNLPLVRLLIKYGANPHIKSYKPRTLAQITAKGAPEPEPNKTPLEMANDMGVADAILNQIKFALEDAQKAQPMPNNENMLQGSLSTLTATLKCIKRYFE